MNNTKRTIGGIGKVFTALLGGILFPILIWVALGVAINHKLQAGRAPAEMFTIADILATANKGAK